MCVIFLLQDGRPDHTYFSEDCFHFSERGHADMAVALWNNMVSIWQGGQWTANRVGQWKVFG